MNLKKDDCQKLGKKGGGRGGGESHSDKSIHYNHEDRNFMQRWNNDFVIWGPKHKPKIF